MNESKHFLQNEVALFTEDTGVIQHVARCLVNWGTCTWCTLRFMGETQQHIYKKPVQEVQSWLDSLCQDDQNGEKRKDTVEEMKAENNSTQQVESPKAGVTVKSNVCITCLGILQEYYSSQEFLNELTKTVEKQGYEFNTFICALSIPVSTILREHALWITLREMEIAKNMYYGRKLEDIPATKEVWKWINGPPLSKLLNVSFDMKSPFEITLNFIHPGMNKECSFLSDLFPDTFKQRKHNRHGWEVFTRINVTKGINGLSEAKFKRNYQCPPRRVAMRCDCDPINATHDSLFVAGRYNKYSRELSQTPWVLGDGNRRSESSIQELICTRLEQRIKPAEYRFQASGREDVDVMMLGQGRPFVVEFLDPHTINLTREDMLQLQKDINGDSTLVRVRDLQVVTREDTSVIKEGETEKTKAYTCKCWVRDPVTESDLDKLETMKELVLSQKTPIRVLHRRNLASRDRIVHKMKATLLDDHHFKLSLKTQAGTYVKEFIHGDFGRTKPNMGIILGVDCDILELDVEAVELDWPPQLDGNDTDGRKAS